MATITIVDPVTRIEGHMKVQVTIDTVGGKQQVTDAQCTGTQFRGFEKILVGRELYPVAHSALLPPGGARLHYSAGVRALDPCVERGPDAQRIDAANRHQ